MNQTLQPALAFNEARTAIAFAKMMQNPRVHRNVQFAIDECIGPSRHFAALQHELQCPFITAITRCLYECALFPGIIAALREITKA